MLTVRLHGHLEESFGSQFEFEAANVREAIDALQANFYTFTKEFSKDERAYNIIVDNDPVDIDGCFLPVSTKATVDIVPVIAGAGNLFATIGLIIVGALLIVASGGTAAGFLTVGLSNAIVAAGGAIGLSVTTSMAVASAIGWGLVLAGVASLLAGPDGPDGDGKAGSSFSGTDNVVGQGIPVPLGYGRLLIGSFVLSSTYSSSWTSTSYAKTYYDTTNNTAKDLHSNYGSFGSDTVDDEGWVPPTAYPQGYTSQGWSEFATQFNSLVPEGTYDVVVTNGRAVSRYVPGASATTLSLAAISRR